MEKKVELLRDYIKSLHDFKLIAPNVPYQHMGETITDAMLQAGIRWETVVEPRLKKLEKYSEAKTTTGFLTLIEKVGARELLDWNDPDKPNRVLGVARFFSKEGVETETDLKVWLCNDANIIRLDNLRGIGNKTIDYFKILAGISTSAIDRHLVKFLNQAGIKISNYEEAREIINNCVEKMQIGKTLLDHSIWKYMSSKSS
jgi:hypothetical protein